MTQPARLICVGGSAGALEPLVGLLRALPAEIDAAVLVAMHLSATAPSMLPDILARATELHVVPAVGQAPLQAGSVYVSVPDRHLLLEDGAVVGGTGPREHGHRPALDVLFRSAVPWGERAVGVLLSGMLDDGVAGLRLLEQAGGRVIVQADGRHPFLPEAALRVLASPEALAADAIAEALLGPPPPRRAGEPSAASSDAGAPEGSAVDDLPPLACPECGGMIELASVDPLVLRCRLGHAYGPQTLEAAQADAVERALWTACRALEDQVAVKRSLAQRLSPQGVRSARRLELDARVAEGHLRLLRRLVRAPLPDVPPGEAA